MGFKAWGHGGHGELNANNGEFQSDDKWVNPRSFVCEYHTCYAINKDGEAQRWGWNTGIIGAQARSLNSLAITQIPSSCPLVQTATNSCCGHRQRRSWKVSRITVATRMELRLAASPTSRWPTALSNARSWALASPE